MNDPVIQQRADIVSGFTNAFQRSICSVGADLTEAMQNALDKFVWQDRNVTVRFDPLPYVLIDEHKALSICYLMLQSALDSNGQQKLLLSVRCEIDNNREEMNLSGLSQYKLYFQTNFPYSDAWYDRNKQSLKECNNLLAEHGGQIEINTKGNGCLFWVLIPGKS